MVFYLFEDRLFCIGSTLKWLNVCFLVMFFFFIFDVIVNCLLYLYWSTFLFILFCTSWTLLCMLMFVWFECCFWSWFVRILYSDALVIFLVFSVFSLILPVYLLNSAALHIHSDSIQLLLKFFVLLYNCIQLFLQFRMFFRGF